LAGLEPDLRVIVAALRSVIRDELPDAIETVDATTPLIGYGFD
jgi:hypothetical protein